MEEKLNYVTNNMKSLRVRLGLSQDEVAKRMHVTRVTYCNYETNPQKVTLGILYELSEILKCKLSDFFIELSVTKGNDISSNQKVE